MEKLENAELALEYKVFGTGEKILLIGIGSSIYNWFPFVKSIMKEEGVKLFFIELTQQFSLRRIILQDYRIDI